MTEPARQATTNARIPLWSMPVAGAMTSGNARPPSTATSTKLTMTQAHHLDRRSRDKVVAAVKRGRQLLEFDPLALILTHFA